MQNVPQLTKEQAIILTGFTGMCMCDFSAFHAEVEKRLGRPVFTHEFASATMTERVKEAFRPDFLRLVGA